MDPSEIYDSQVHNEKSPEEFVLHARLPSLQEMAYNRIAIAVWYGYRSTPSQRHYALCGHESTNKLELIDCHKLIKTLTIPRFMKETLKKHLKRVREETIRCTQYFGYELFSTNLYEYGICHVDWEYFVWRPDGIINYKSTAIKMLHSGVLTEMQKFAIMSNFCLENEIKIFDLKRRPMKTFITKVNGDRDPLLFYWICYLKNKPPRIVPSSIGSSDHKYLTYGKCHGVAFEYFWNRLSAEEQVSFTMSKLSMYDYSRHWHYSLFCKMSHDQLTKLLFCEPVAMISVFIKGMENPEWAITAWKLYKNWISNEQFVELLVSQLDKFDKNLILHRERRMSVLLEIWNTANDHQKNHAATQTRLEDAAVHLTLSANLLQTHFAIDGTFIWKKLAPSSFKFLLKFLSLKNVDFRKNLILEGDLSFIFNFDLNVVQEILELCLPNFQDNVELKSKLSEYTIDRHFCEILYSEEDHDELNRRLLHSFQNLNISSNDVRKFVVESLITANKREHKAYDTSTVMHRSYLRRLSKFTNKILQEKVSTVLEMKQSYISSFSDNSDPYERYGSLHELSKLIEQEFVHEHLQELKRRLAKKLQTTSLDEWVWYVSNYERYADVFSWCCENEEELFLQVTRCIPINNIFVKVLERIMPQDPFSFRFIIPDFNNWERFLEWYFSGVAEKVISFKLGIMNVPETAKILKYIRENKNNKWLHGMFLQWNWLSQ